MAIDLFHNVCEDEEWVQIMVEQDLLRFLPIYFLEEAMADMSKIERYPHDLPEVIQEWLEERCPSGARATVSADLGPAYYFMKVVHDAIRMFQRLGDLEERVETMMEHDLLRFLPLYFLEDQNEEDFEEYRGILPINIQEWLEKRRNERSASQ